MQRRFFIRSGRAGCALVYSLVVLFGLTWPLIQSRAESKTATDASDVQVVIAEGVGKDNADATKDALRNAVRQVVGALVDIETLVKNDDIVTDKVLTYSDGFISSSKELASKTENGLVRVRVQAQVERRSLIARLKGANVTVKTIDGQSLFAEAVTQLQATDDAAAMLTKLLENYPANVVKAEVLGKPQIKKNEPGKIVLGYDLKIGVDQDLYGAFIKKLVPQLEKLALRKGEVVSKGKADLNAFWCDSALRPYAPARKISPTDPMVTQSDGFLVFGSEWRDEKMDGQKQCILVVNASSNAAADRLVWKWYHVVNPHWNFHPLKIDISFQNVQGGEIVRDQLRLAQMDCLPGMRYTIPFEGRSRASELMLSPTILAAIGGDFRYCRSIIFPSEVTVNEQELKQMQHIECTVKLEEATGAGR